MTERTLLLIKPNAVHKKLIGRIIESVEENRFQLLEIKSFNFTTALAGQFYEEHQGKEFFQRLVEFMISGTTIGLLLEKENAITDLRTLVGDTLPEKQKPGTLRYMFSDGLTENAVHASDSSDHAHHEISLIFPEYI